MIDVTINEEILLSICIPTYNRSDVLIQLITNILSVERKDINIAVIDNCSTDNTIDQLKLINDSRLQIIARQNPVPAVNNMMDAFFGGIGRYTMFMLDKEQIDSEGLSVFCDWLEKAQNVAFVHTSDSRYIKDEKVVTYDNPYDALMNCEFANIVSGLVYNNILCNEYIDKKLYYRYLDTGYPMLFVERDFFLLGDFVTYNVPFWRTNPIVDETKRKSNAIIDTGLWFSRELNEHVCQSVLKQIVFGDKFGLSDDQKTDVGIRTLKYFWNRVTYYKVGMISSKVSNHYGVKKRRVSNIQLLSICMKYHFNMLSYLKNEQYLSSLISKWTKCIPEMALKSIWSGLKYDRMYFKSYFKLRKVTA